MADWWEAAPLANETKAQDNWWEAAPPVGMNPGQEVPSPELKPTIQEPAPPTPEQPSWLSTVGSVGKTILENTIPRITDPFGTAVKDVRSMFTPSESLKKDINAQAAIDPAEVVNTAGEALTPPIASEEGSNFAFWHRGWNRNLRDLQAGRVAVGELSPQEAAQNYVFYEQEAQKYRYDDDVVKALQQYPTEGSTGEVLSWMWNNPKATATMFGDNLAGVAVGAALPVGAGVAASPFGPGASTAAFAGTAGISSAVMTAMQTISDELADSGVDINNIQQVENAFSSPEFMQRATKRAILHGVPVGVVDMITGLAGAKGVGGKIVDGVWKQAFKSAEGEAIKGTVKRAVAETGVNTAMDMAGAGVGEAAGQLLSTGQIQPSQLIPEIAFELPGSVVQGGYETYLASKQNFDPATAEMIAKAAAMGGETASPPIVDADTAAAEGRTFYGFAEPGKPVEVTTDYAAAERKMGAGDGKRGQLIAVRPEEVEGDAGDVATALIDARKKGQNESQVVDQIVASVPEENKPAAIQAVTAVIQSKSPEERAAAWTMAQSLGAKITPRTIELGDGPVTIGSYRGPIEGRIITPRLEQPLRFGGTKIESATTGIVVHGSGLTESGTDLDGKKFFQALKGKALVAVPQVRAALEVWGRKAIEPMVQIADEDLRRQVYETKDPVDLEVWRQAVRDGKVTFNPDGRLFSRTKAVGVIDATKEEVAAAVKAATIKQPKGTAWIPQQSDLESNSSGKKYHDVERARFRDLQPGEVKVLNFSTLPNGNMQLTISELAKKWQREFGLNGKLVLFFHDTNRGIPNSHIDSQVEAKAQGFADASFGRWIRAAEGIYSSLGENVHVIGISLNQRPAAVYHTLIHEFGHYISASKFSQAPVEVRAKVFAAYRRWLEQLPEKGLRLSSIPPARRHFSANYASALGINDWFYQDPGYMFSFEEWFAEQVARWGMTKAKPLGALSRFFKGVAQAVIRMVRDARAKFPEEKFEPETEIEDFLASLRSGIGSNSWGAQTEAEYEAQTAEKNRPYLKEDTVPLQAETTQASAVMRNVMNSAPQVNPSTVASINAHNDRFNWFYKLGLTIRQVALRNPNNPLLAPLYRYLEYVDLAKQEANTIMGDADQILLKSRNLKGKVGRYTMSDQLSFFIDDLNNMVYLSPQEQQAGVRRHPTPAEFSALAKQYGLSNEAISLYMEIKGFFDQSVERFYQLDVLEAGKLSDPRAQAAALKNALTRKRQMLASPYFPKTRFGKWAVTVRDANGKVQSFELFDTKKGQAARQRELEASKGAGETVTVSELPQEAEPFVGIPAWLLDKLNALPGMTPLQKQWIEQLRYHLAPQRSFAKHFLKRKNTPGYELDWRRSFGHYAFHHARNFSRLKYGELARKETELLLGAEEERTSPFLSRIGNMMAEHYKEFVNPSRDWAVLRSVTALFHLGFSPATAMMNLSQVPLVTLPFLADKFGDGHAMGALQRAAGSLSTYYKKGKLAQQTGPEFRAINEAVRQGIIDESQAWQLASFSGGSKSKTKQKVREAWLRTTSVGMAMFGFAEQWNRRVTFRAAYDLAYNNPTAKWVRQLDVRHSIELANLIQNGWTDREARAFLGAKETVQQTQFAYDKLERPKFMWGRKANLFAFYMFTQNMLFTMWNNPGAAGRYMLAMALLAGPMGLVPDDIEDILNAVARQLFGKDFNLERYARSLVVDMIGETAPGEEPKIAPDLILHGTSRYSYGIPWLMSQVGVDWLPNVDRSKSITINRVMPMGGMTSLLRPSSDVNQSIYNATQDVAGAAFGPGLAIYKALSQSDLSLFDLRNWQAAMPKAARSVTEAVRNFYNGGQVDRKGTMQVPYDRNDPQQVAELIATMLGYQPTRKSQFYDRQSAIYEVDQYWSTRRQQLLQDAFVDRFDTGDPEAWADAQQAIRDFNTAASQVDKKYVITTDTIKRSFQAKQKRRKDMERGTPPGVSPGAAQSVGRLYPEANVIFTKKVH